jgi:hypothetical protein
MTPWYDFIPMVLSECLTVALLIVFIKRRAFAIVPFFGIYIVYSTVAAAARMLTSSNYFVFFYVFWATELIYIVLAATCVYKSLSACFKGLLLLPIVRYLYPSLCAIVIAYAWVKAAIRPPLNGYPITNVAIGIEIGAQYLISASFILFIGGMAWLKGSRTKYHLEIVSGFGIASLGMLLGTLVRSEFGTRFIEFSKYAPTVAYLLALVIWLSAFFTPLKDAQLVDAGITASSAERALDEYKNTLRNTGRWES